MFRWINIRGSIGGSVKRDSAIEEPINYPDSETNSTAFVFVHGFRMSETEALGASTEMFKRLYQFGSKAKFAGVAWYGDYVPLVNLDYYTDVHNAFLSANALTDKLNEAGFSGTQATICAHSLGNMLVSSAIAECGLKVGTYCMVNAAVSFSAYANGSNPNNVMIHPEWRNFYDAGQGRCSASNWGSLYPNADDVRKKLYTWSGLFKKIVDINCINYYSSGDEVLRNFDASNPDAKFPDSLFNIGRDGIWYAQEINKGRWTLAGCGNSQRNDLMSV